jgi:predicted HTH domain antitoxin
VESSVVQGPERLVYNVYKVNDVGTISARLPEDIEADLERYLEEEQLDRSTAVRKLLAEGLDEWRRERAIEKLDAGEITFARAAEMAGLSVWDFARLTEERDVTWVGADHLSEDLESL